ATVLVDVVVPAGALVGVGHGFNHLVRRYVGDVFEAAARTAALGASAGGHVGHDAVAYELSAGERERAMERAELLARVRATQREGHGRRKVDHVERVVVGRRELLGRDEPRQIALYIGILQRLLGRRRIDVLERADVAAATNLVVGDVVLDQPVEVRALGDRRVEPDQLVLVRIARAVEDVEDLDVLDERTAVVFQLRRVAPLHDGIRRRGRVGAGRSPQWLRPVRRQRGGWDGERNRSQDGERASDHLLDSLFGSGGGATPGPQ